MRWGVLGTASATFLHCEGIKVLRVAVQSRGPGVRYTYLQLGSPAIHVRMCALSTYLAYAAGRVLRSIVSVCAYVSVGVYRWTRPGAHQLARRPG